MLESIENINRTRRKRIMAGSSSDSTSEIDVEGIHEIDLVAMINGYVATMRRKYRTQLPPQKVVDSLDGIVKELEFGFKFSFKVASVDYNDTDSESSSEAPPPAQRRRFEKKRAAPEQYMNRLESRIQKFIFAEDEDHGKLFITDVQRKLCLIKFILKLGLSESDIRQFIPQERNT